MKARFEDTQPGKTNALILGVFAFFFLTKLLTWMPRDIFSNTTNLWVFTDWLIDYSAGFTRRGLSGEFISYMAAFMRPRIAVGFLTWVIFIAVTLGYVRLIWRALPVLRPLLLVALLFLPSLFPFYLHDHNTFGRKETLGFLFLLWHLYLLEKAINTQEPKAADNKIVADYIRRILPLALILLPAHVFIHESSFFLFVPAHMTLTFSLFQSASSLKTKKKVLYLILIYLPVVISLAAVAIYGQPEFAMSRAICKKWERANALEPGACNQVGQDTIWGLPGSFTSLHWPISQAATSVLYLSTKSIISWLSVFSVFGILAALIGKRISVSFANIFSGNAVKHPSTIILRRYFLFPLLFSLPVYALGSDMGRWFAVTSVNYIMMSLSREVNFMAFTLSKNKEAGARTKNKGTIGSEATRVYLIELFVLLFVIFYIRLPHCCANEFTILAEPLSSLLMKLIELF